MLKITNQNENKMKKILIPSLVVTIGCLFITQIQKPQIIEENLAVVSPKKQIFTIESSASYSLDLKNVDAMYNAHEYIAIVHIDELYPATTYRKYTDEYILPYTPGKATVIKALKGNFESNEISFLRLGGTVSFSDYVNSLPAEGREKFINLFDTPDKNNILVYDKTKGDIDIEDNKTYLVFMNRQDDFHENNEYTIEAFEYGLREVNMNNTQSISSNITIKNNKTGEYESLTKAVSKEIQKELSSSSEK